MKYNSENSSSIVRWTLLICISIMTMGIMYSNDTLPAISPFIFEAFENKLDKKEYDYYYNILCSLASVPNVIVPLLAGVLIDTVNLYNLSAILIFFLFLGQGLLTIGFNITSFWLMLLGRTIFGLGSESSLIVFNSIIIRCFPSWEVALALSICLAVGRVGSVLSDMVSPLIATLFPLYWTLIFGLAILFIGGVSVLVNLNKFKDKSILMPINYSKSKFDSESDHFNSKSKHNKYSITSTVNEIKREIKDLIFSLNELGDLYWYLAILGLVTYSVIMPFNFIAGTLIVETQYKNIPSIIARQYAGVIMSLLFAVSVLILPVLGWVVDKIGERCKILILSISLLTFAHAVMLSIHPAISITILGLGYTLFSTVYWPCVSISVDQNRLGTALGLITCIQNIGFIIVPIQVAFLHSTFNSYLAVEIFFLFLCSMALFLSLYIYHLDRKFFGKLNSPSNKAVEEEDLDVSDERYDYNPQIPLKNVIYDNHTKILISNFCDNKIISNPEGISIKC